MPRPLTTEPAATLRPHVINLNEGMLTEGGEYSTLPEDVERLFGEDMERAFADPESHGMPPRPPGDPFRVMLWAHGGLIDERQGLAIASKHREFWMGNGIYPVYFVWETGLLQTIGQLLRGILPRIGARDIISAAISDPALERAVRAAGGDTVWSGMKRNAERAVLPSGGGRKALQELKRFCDRHAGAIELHAAGHSAGAIFLSHLLPPAFDADFPPFSGLYLLAPAIRVDSFKEQLLGLIGKKVRHTTLLTMVKEGERDDHCAHVYRKSLLYLIRFALEREREAEILGLEESLRRDRELARLFGLAGHPPAAGEVIFSPSPSVDGRSASRSTSHGGFDDDASSMNSIARRVLNLPDSAALPRPYPEGTRDLDEDAWVVPEVAELQRSFATAVLPPAAQQTAAVQAAPPIPTAAPAIPGVQTDAATSSVVVPASSQVRGRALCVGIDRYPVRPLAGCVADARLWARTLHGLGFDCELLVDGEATYDGIKTALARLIASAREGDVVVWQYAGHGTQVPDVDGDEQAGDSAGTDEAICPIDLQSGRLFVDDEIAAMTANLAAGVNFTMFMDCCHSGTISRFGFGPPPAGSVVRDERARFLPLSEEIKQAYQAFAQKRPRSLTRSARRAAAARASSEALFSACLSTELAWESDGHGEFTLRATTLLRERGLSFTNQAFIDAVVSAFGAKPRQTPNITSVSGLRGAGLLQPVGATTLRNEARAVAAASAERDRYAALAGAFDDVARSLRAL